jgi:diaminopimelate epimerase
VEFVKAHGTGNDFVVVEDLSGHYQLTPELVRAVCDRHFGVGADGLIRIAPGTDVPFFMDYRNADGSFDLETRAGVKHLELHADDGGCIDRVTVDMGPPEIEDERTLDVDGEPVTATVLSMGNPHAVVFVDDVDKAPVATLGPRLETHPAFLPAKTNVEFAQVVDQATVRQRTWERGVGETLACGTGACAVAVAAQVRGLTGHPVAIELRGGRLELDWTPGGTVRMTGPAREVAHGTLTDDLLASAR